MTAAYHSSWTCYWQWTQSITHPQSNHLAAKYRRLMLWGINGLFSAKNTNKSTCTVEQTVQHKWKWAVSYYAERLFPQLLFQKKHNSCGCVTSTLKESNLAPTVLVIKCKCWIDWKMYCVGSIMVYLRKTEFTLFTGSYYYESSQWGTQGLYRLRQIKAT